MSTIKVGDRVSAGFAVGLKPYRMNGAVVNQVGDYLLSIKLDEPLPNLPVALARIENCHLLKGPQDADVHCQRS
jgi:hypothetical protein